MSFFESSDYIFHAGGTEKVLLLNDISLHLHGEHGILVE